MSNEKRKKIVVLIDWYLPGYKAGGPIPSVANIVLRLKDFFEFAIITSDTDAGETTPYPNIRSDEWNILADGTRVYYFSEKGKSFTALKKLILSEQADVIYLNSLFSVYFTIYPLIIRKYFLPSRKTVLAPRGMLGKGALQIKGQKKTVFLFLAKIAGLYNKLIWHASTNYEENEIATKFGKHQRILVASDLTSGGVKPSFDRIKEKGNVRFVFLSRISSKKNLLVSINTLFRMSSNYQIEFDIYGPVDDIPYWSQCQEAILKAPPHVKINYKGAIANTEIRKILETYHFSLLHTHHENYGHSIIESMCGGCPAVISDKTPWRNLANSKAGWDIALNDETSLVNTLQLCCEMDQQTFTDWSKAAFSFGESVINNPQLIEDNKRLFK